MAILSGGASMPSKLRMISKYQDNPEALKQAGIAYAVDQIIDLLSNDIDGIHLYTMNKPETAQKIVNVINNLLLIICAFARELMNGKLYLCATPIGNLGDVSARCLEAFNNADLIAAEDTRRTLQLLNRTNIKTRQATTNTTNTKKGEYIISLLKNGKNIVLVSDAGTPAISDPGEDLVQLCIENDIDVTSIPGPVAGINALILSGLPTRRFAFEGFLSVNKRHKRTS